MQFIGDIQLDYADVLIRPQTTNINHRGEVEVVRHFKQLEPDLGMGYIEEFRCCPVMNANMTQTGTFEVAKVLLENDMIGCIHKFYNSDEIRDFLTNNPQCNKKTFFVTIGLRNQDEEIKKLEDIEFTNYKHSIMIDVPNAYIPDVEKLVKRVRKTFSQRIIAVGNVCTGDRTQELIKAGAQIIKVGVGPSQVCRTRHTTGCGRPQLSAVIECADAAHQVGGLIIADGGFNMPGDISKAFVAGADICMSGSMFAGCDEASGEIIEKMYRTNEYNYGIYEADSEESYGALTDENGNPTKKGELIGDSDCFIINKNRCLTLYKAHKPVYEIKKFKEYYGMSSFRAQCENYGKKTTTGTSEGVESKLIPYTGPVIDTINNIKGGLRSTGSYIGAKNIKSFSRQGSFYRVNRVQ